MNRPHILVVSERNDADGPFDVQHFPDCPTAVLYDSPFGPVTDYSCDVGYHEQQQAGLDEFFVHRDDPEADDGRTVLTPGCYLIEGYTEQHRYASGTEFDDGLRLAFTVPLEEGK